MICSLLHLFKTLDPSSRGEETVSSHTSILDVEVTVTLRCHGSRVRLSPRAMVPFPIMMNSDLVNPRWWTWTELLNNGSIDRTGSSDKFNDWGGGGGIIFVPVLGGNNTKIAPTGDIFDQPPGQMR